MSPKPMNCNDPEEKPRVSGSLNLELGQCMDEVWECRDQEIDLRDIGGVYIRREVEEDGVGREGERKGYICAR